MAYLRLMRIPNVFTAIADVAMGFLFVHDYQSPEQFPRLWPTLALLIAASSLLYTAGLVLNDLFDFEIDRKERPFRPLPSGQVSKSGRGGWVFCCWRPACCSPPRRVGFNSQTMRRRARGPGRGATGGGDSRVQRLAQTRRPVRSAWASAGCSTCCWA